MISYVAVNQRVKINNQIKSAPLLLFRSDCLENSPFHFVTLRADVMFSRHDKQFQISFRSCLYRDTMINNYLRYPLGELESLTSTIFCRLQMIAEYY